MNVKVEVVHNGETTVFEGDGFVEGWTAIKDAGGLLADLTAAELQLRATNIEQLAEELNDR